MTVVLVPVYDPVFELTDFVSSLRQAAGLPVVLVDDGSGPAAAAVFGTARDLGCVVLRHEVNRGKGAALKTGLAHIAERFPGQDVVSADGDGQHRVEDVQRVARHTEVTGRLVLGVRGFEGAVPWRSRFGNTVTSWLFTAATGRLIADTQTGLRGMPAALLPRLLAVPGERFDYEMNVLLDAARSGLPIEQVTISTTYLRGNASSHFGSVTDSALIYRRLLRATVTRPAAKSQG